MEHQVIWSLNALACIDRIGVFIILNDGVINAEKVISRIIDRGGRLKTFPESGRKVPEFPDIDYHEVMVSKYRIIYEIIGKNVNILSVIHMSRILKSVDA